MERVANCEMSAVHMVMASFPDNRSRLTLKLVCKAIKVKVKNDHRSKFSNLSNWKEEA